MERIELAEELEVSRIVYGMWRLGKDVDRSPARVQAKIEACLEQGITTFDQADIYGDYESEMILGQCLKDQPALRAGMEIVTKCGIMLVSGKYPARRMKHYDTSGAHITASVEASLRHMAIETIDVLLLHRPDPLMDHLETGRALDDLVDSGKVRAIGVSNFRPHDWNLLQSAMEQPLVTNQIELSLLAHDGLTNGDVAFLQERGIPPMAWSPLAGGALFEPEQATMRAALSEIGAHWGVDETAVAIAWLLAHPALILPVMGTNNLDRIRRLSDATKVAMDRETWFHLYTLAMGHEVP